MTRKLILKDYDQEKRLFQRRLIVAAIVIVLLIGLLVFRLIYLQVYQHELYSTMSQKNHLEFLPIEPNRGLIYDRNGILLAENQPVFSLDVIPDKVQNLKETLTNLQKIINISQNNLTQFYQALKQHRVFNSIPLKLKLSDEEVASFYVNQYQFPGVIIDAGMIRYYPLGKTMAGVLGYVGRIDYKDLIDLDSTNYSATNFIGKSGVEKYYEQQLHGEIGYQQVEVDASGRTVRTLNRIPPVPGDKLYLTIDSKLQSVAEEALNGERGAVVAIQPRTGEVLTLVSSPSFDPNLFVQGMDAKQYKELQTSPDKPMYNKAIHGQYPFASIIKPFLALEGLDSGVITPQYTIFDPGWFKLPNTNHIYLDWNWKLGGHGYVNVSKALIVSSDPFFYNLAVMLGIDRIDDILNRFGFGRVTGIDMPDEAGGLVPSPKWKMRVLGDNWYTGDTVISGIGQGFMLTTPLQLAQAASTLANRGLRFQPYLLLKFQTSDGQISDIGLIAEDPVMLSRQAAWQVVIQAMQGVVTSREPWGTARIRFGTNLKYTIAAKTGTGQVYSSRSRDENATNVANIPKYLRNHSLFIGFAPVKNPKIAIAVIVEHSPIAGTVARKVLDYYFDHINHEKI
jgi:penicillin-binding protein 2